MQFSPFAYFFVPVKSKRPNVEHPQPIFFSVCERPVSRLYKTEGKIMFLYILANIFLENPPVKLFTDIYYLNNTPKPIGGILPFAST
jgi:hypothetical protein